MLILVKSLNKFYKNTCVEALEVCKNALKPGEPIGKVFDAYISICDKKGMKYDRFNACGYSLGATFSSTWMDWPMFYHGNMTLAEPGMVFFPQAILMDRNTQQAISIGHTVIVTENGCKSLSKLSTDLYVS